MSCASCKISDALFNDANGLRISCTRSVEKFSACEILRGFSFAMILGVLIGTYSSIFVASPVLKFFKVSYKTLEKKDEKIVP